jgi:hypothetical protein
MNQTNNESKVENIFREGSVTYKAIQILIENGPLTTQEIREIIGCYKPRIGNTLCQSPEIYFMGDTKCGVWYLEYQNQDARKRYCELCKETEKRLEITRKNQLKFNQPGTDSFIKSNLQGNEWHTTSEIWSLVESNVISGNIIDLRVRLSHLAENGDLSVKGKSPKFYKLNSNHSN